MLAAENTEMSIQWLKKHEALHYNLICVFQKTLADFARKQYALTSTLDCFQAVYMSDEPPVLNRSIQIHTASDEDLKIITDNYKRLDEQELKKIIQRRELFIGTHDNKTVGFVGQHLEGSMGLLEILPMYRGNGYGTELESYLIAHMLEKGLIPFCQVEVDNYKSLGLQKKVGLAISDEHVYWLF